MGETGVEIPSFETSRDATGEDTDQREVASESPNEAIAAAAPDPAEPQIVDVWSRTQPHYRIRAYTLLALNLILFCGLCAFNHWLHFARAFEFSLESYLAPFRFWDPTSPNLTGFILAPISVVDVPLHAVVLGLVLAVMTSVPIVVSVLYRFRWSLPFLAAVLIFGHMPWMAFCLLGSCVIASLRPFRMKFRFASALLGLAPILLYLYLATRGDEQHLASYVSPAEKMLLIAPWLLAIIAASVILGVVLLIARIVNYRPGAVAPVLMVMFATPVALFHLGVGSDELAYRILEAEYGPRSRRFEPVFKSRETQDAIWELVYSAIGSDTLQGQLRSDLLGLWSLQPEKFRELKRSVSRRFLAEFLSDRAAARRACEGFIADHPQSRHIPNVLYILGRVLDTRLDEAKLAQVEPNRELYTDFPHVESEEVWLKLLKQYPQSPFSVLAGLNLAKLELRSGEIVPALESLRFAADPQRFANGNAGSDNDANAGGRLVSGSPESHLDFKPEPYRLEAQRLIELIENNRIAADDQLALVELARLDARRAGYLGQLQRLADQCRDTALYDNLVVLWAAAQPNIADQAEALAACARTFTSGDAVPEALFRLADLETQTLAADDKSRREDGLSRFREIVARYPDTFWARRAEQRLEVLRPGAVEAGGLP